MIYEDVQIRSQTTRRQVGWHELVAVHDQHGGTGRWNGLGLDVAQRRREDVAEGEDPVEDLSDDVETRDMNTGHAVVDHGVIPDLCQQGMIDAGADTAIVNDVIGALRMDHLVLVEVGRPLAVLTINVELHHVVLGGIVSERDKLATSTGSGFHENEPDHAVVHVMGDAVWRTFADTVVDIESGVFECQGDWTRIKPRIRRHQRGAALIADDGVEVYGVSDAGALVIQCYLVGVARRYAQKGGRDLRGHARLTAAEREELEHDIFAAAGPSTVCRSRCCRRNSCPRSSLGPKPWPYQSPRSYGHMRKS